MLQPLFEWLPWLESLVLWVRANQTLVWWLASGSLVFVLISILLIPWLLIRVPPDYFAAPGKYRSALLGDHFLAALLFKVIRNTLGTVLVVLGLLLLVLPGQGLLTILLGVLIADFPGRHRLVNRLVRQPSVFRSINWLRHKAGKLPVHLD